MPPGGHLQSSIAAFMARMNRIGAAVSPCRTPALFLTVLPPFIVESVDLLKVGVLVDDLAPIPWLWRWRKKWEKKEEKRGKKEEKREERKDFTTGWRFF